MTLINLTPHTVNVYAAEVPDRVTDYDDGLLFRIEPAEKPARVAMIDLGHSRNVYADDGDDGEIRSTWVELIEFGHIHDLPQPESDTTFIVSLVVALAAPGRTDLVFPMSEIRNTAGTVIGCRGFGRVC